jgi:hypothetical protein
MMIKKSLLLRGAILTGLLLAGTLVVDGSAGAADWGSAKNIEAAAAAIPAQAGDTSNDLSVHVDRPGRRTVRASAVATSSATCDGCSASAVTMQVIYARTLATLRIDNVAAAWSSCTGCQSAALSLQVVIARRAGVVTAGNRALAVNAGCVGCRTAAAAVQIVVVSPTNRELTKADLNGLESLRKQLEAQLTAQLVRPAAARAQTLAKGAPQAAQSQAAQQQALTSATTQIQALVTNALGGTSAQPNIQVQTGS